RAQPGGRAQLLPGGRVERVRPVREPLRVEDVHVAVDDPLRLHGPIVVHRPRRGGPAPGERNSAAVRGPPPPAGLRTPRSVQPHHPFGPLAPQRTEVSRCSVDVHFAPGRVMVDRTLDDAEGRSAAGPKVGPDPRRPPAWTDRVPDLLASYLAAVATFCAVTALLPVLREPLAWLRTAIEIVSVGAPPSLATAAFLGILAAAVRRRMRAAWWFVVLYLVLGRILGWITVLIDTDAQDPVTVSAGSGVLGWLRVGFGVAALALLLLARKRFTARTQRGS